MSLTGLIRALTVQEVAFRIGLAVYTVLLDQASSNPLIKSPELSSVTT